MSGSYLNIIFFIVATIVYYLKIKPPLSLDIISSPDKLKTYTSSGYVSLAIFVLLVIFSQVILNISNITASCGGSISENIGAAGLMTFFPWVLMFGVLVIVLTLYPGFKSAFSDVIGYFYVSSTANTILAELLVDKDIQQKLDVDTTSTVAEKSAMQDAAEAIIKICGNSSIIINQMVPLNFVKYWNILKPLMKPMYQKDSDETTSIKTKLFDLVVTRDNIGEAMWFTYTGILIVSSIQLNIANRGCVSSAATMEKNYQVFLDDENKAQKERDDSTNQVFTMS